MEAAVVVNEGGVAWLRLAGEIDLRVTEELDRAMSELIHGEHAGVVVDLSSVTFLESAGIAVLVSAYRQASAAGTAFRVCGPSGGVLRVLDVCGITELLTAGTPGSAP